MGRRSQHQTGAQRRGKVAQPPSTGDVRRRSKQKARSRRNFQRALQGECGPVTVRKATPEDLERLGVA